MKGEKMKIRNWIMVMVVLLLCHSEVLAFDPMGPPTAGLKQNQFSAGAEYLYSEIDLEADGTPTLGLGSDVIKSIESNKVYGRLGYGLTDDWEIFVRLGAADADPDKSDNSDNVAGYIGGSDYGFAIGGGTKVTFHESEDGKLKWGVLAQMSWTDLDFDRKSYSIGGHNVIFSTDIEVLEVQIALGPTYELNDTISIYGGPFFHIVDGDADLKGSIDGSPGKVSTDLEQDSLFGGYVGMEFELTDNLDYNIEFQGTGGGNALGMALVYKF